MPESYTHVMVAQAAAKNAAVVLANRLDKYAFCCGANGPDVFYYYQVWRKAEKRTQDLSKLAVLLHTKQTGAFLQALVKGSQTNAQRSYTLGFISHYYADCTLHPYVKALTKEGMPYCQPFGHARFETDLDSALHYSRHQTGKVEVSYCVPGFRGAARAEVVALLHNCIRQVYGLEISSEAISDAFDHMRMVKKVLNGPGPVQSLACAAEAALGQKGNIRARITADHPLSAGQVDIKSLPRSWKNPYNGRGMQGGAQELMREAVRLSAGGFFAAQSWWDKKENWQTLTKRLGNRNMITGLEL